MTELFEMTLLEGVTLIAALGALGTSIWSNFTAHKALKSSGRQRLSEFRKEWIESLRLNLAEMHALGFNRLILAETNKTLDADIENIDFVAARKKNQSEINATLDRSTHLFSFITLMLNSEEEPHEKLTVCMREILKSYPTKKNLNEFLTQSRTVLKLEWDKLKLEFE